MSLYQRLTKSLPQVQLGLSTVGLLVSIVVNLRTFTKGNVDAPDMRWAVIGLLLLLLAATAPLIWMKARRNETERPSNSKLFYHFSKGALTGLLLYSMATWICMLHATNGVLARRENGKPILTLRYGYKVGGISEEQYQLYRGWELLTAATLFAWLFFMLSIRLGAVRPQLKLTSAESSSGHHLDVHD